MAYCCSIKVFAFVILLSAIPIAFLISLETAKPTTNVYRYHSTGYLRESGKWDDLNRRFLVSFLEGGIGEIRVPDDHTPTTVLDEVPVVKDADYAGNATVGIVIDRPRNRLMVAIVDIFGSRYSALAAYDLTSWNRLFLTRLNAPDEKSFADDVAVDPEGNAYVTDAKNSKIWKVGLKGQVLATITSPLFRAKEWYKNLIGLNGIVYHPNGYLIAIHTFSGNLFKVEIGGDEEAQQVKLIGVADGPLSFGDGLELLSPTELVVAGSPARLVESSDEWETAKIVGKFKGPMHRLTTAVTVKEGKAYLSHMVGLGFPKKKHVFVEAVFSS